MTSGRGAAGGGGCHCSLCRSGCFHHPWTLNTQNEYLTLLAGPQSSRLRVLRGPWSRPKPTPRKGLKLGEWTPALGTVK